MRTLRNTSSIDDFFGDFNQMMNTFLTAPASENTTRVFTPSCDIEETGDHFLLSFDMPGFDEEDLNIEVKDNTLTVSGERSRQWKDTSGENYVRHERSYGKFQRSFSLPRNVSSKDIEAHYDKGVLQLALPKAEVTTGHRIEVKNNKEGFFSKLLGDKSSKDTTKQ